MLVASEVDGRHGVGEGGFLVRIRALVLGLGLVGVGQLSLHPEQSVKAVACLLDEVSLTPRLDTDRYGSDAHPGRTR
jgi:hypothetical protein